MDSFDRGAASPPPRADAPAARLRAGLGWAGTGLMAVVVALMPFAAFRG